nr:hypothetical protein [Tanacetum cinerariifolium]
DNSAGDVCRVDGEWVLAVLVSGKRRKNVLLVLAGSTFVLVPTVCVVYKARAGVCAGEGGLRSWEVVVCSGVAGKEGK